jgi:flagellar FliJ protein
MARFVFKLEGVLRHRLEIERGKQRALAVVRAQMTELETQLRDLDRRAQESTQDIRNNRLTGVLDMQFLGAHRRFMIAMQRQAMEIVQRMAGVKRKVDDAQRELLEAAKQRKVIEKLKERQQERWRADMNRSEAHQLDEIGMQLGYENSTVQP